MTSPISMNQVSLTHRQRAHRRAQIAQYVRSGATLEAAAQRFGVSVGLAERACREHLVDAPARAGHLTHKQRAARREQIAKFVKLGRSLEEAAQEFGVTVERVRFSCLEHYGAVPAQAAHVRPSGPKYWGTRARKALRLLEAGKLNQVEIAVRLGLSRERIRQIAAKAIKLGILSPEGKKWRVCRSRSAGASAQARRNAR